MYPVKRFSRPARGTVEKPWPVFSAFLFFTNPILYSFSQYPPFFPLLPRPLCFSALFAAGGWKR